MAIKQNRNHSNLKITSYKHQKHVFMDMPIGDPFGGPAYGEKNEPFSLATVIAFGVTVGDVALGLTAISAVTSIAGAVTGDKTLLSIGQWTGIAGGVVGGLGAIGGALTEAGILGAGEAAAGNIAESAIGNAANDAIGSAGLESLGRNALSSATDAGLPSTLSSQISDAIPSSLGSSAASAAVTPSSFIPAGATELGTQAADNVANSLSSGLGNVDGSTLSEAIPNASTTPATRGLTSSSGLGSSALPSSQSTTGGITQAAVDNVTPSFGSNATSSVGNITDIARPTSLLDTGIKNFSTTGLVGDATKYSVDAAGNLTDITGKAWGNIKDVGSDAWNWAQKNQSLVGTLYSAGKDTLNSLLGQPGQEAQQKLLDAQNAQNKAQANALARQALWRKGVSGSSLLSYR